MAESFMQPSEFFASAHWPTHKIPVLTRSPQDVFWVVPFTTYTFKAQEILHKQHEKKDGVSGLHPTTANYLADLVSWASGHPPRSEAMAAQFGLINKDSQNNAIKYFGEVIGPLWVNTNRPLGRSYHSVVMPLTSNYALFDYFCAYGNGSDTKYDGFSAKAAKGGSNTLAPKLITERLKAIKVEKRDEQTAKILLMLANEPTFLGTTKAVGALAKLGIFPPGTPREISTAFARWSPTDWAADGARLEARKTVPLRQVIENKQRLAVYQHWLNDCVVSTMRTKVAPKTGWTSTNLMYGFIGFYLAKIGGSAKFNLTPMLARLFPDLHIVKMGIGAGMPHMYVTHVGEKDNTVSLRSKARWDVVKDKIGAQL